MSRLSDKALDSSVVSANTATKAMGRWVDMEIKSEPATDLAMLSMLTSIAVSLNSIAIELHEANSRGDANER